MSIIVIMCSFPNHESVSQLAEKLVADRLAACVQILSPSVSIYQWQGQIEKTEETLIQIKTTTACYAQIEQTILENHPYELPEIIQVPVIGGLPAYLQWVEKQTS